MRKRWDQWVERFRNTSLARKMMVVYAAIFGILCGITLLAMQVTLSIYDGQLYQKSLEELNFFTERVDGELKRWRSCPSIWQWTTRFKISCRS